MGSNFVMHSHTRTHAHTHTHTQCNWSSVSSALGATPSSLSPYLGDVHLLGQPDLITSYWITGLLACVSLCNRRLGIKLAFCVPLPRLLRCWKVAGVSDSLPAAINQRQTTLKEIVWTCSEKWTGGGGVGVKADAVYRCVWECECVEELHYCP